MKLLACITLTVALTLFSTFANSKTKSSSFAPNWSEEAHLSSPKHHASRGAHHAKGNSSSQKGGHSKSHAGNHEPRPASTQK
jgi:hypothetical protein